jgi:hypothetical protein
MSNLFVNKVWNNFFSKFRREDEIAKKYSFGNGAKTQILTSFNETMADLTDLTPSGANVFLRFIFYKYSIILSLRDSY